MSLLATDALWHIDEFALDYHHAAHASIRQGLLTEPQARAVLALDELFDQMSGENNARLWTTEALLSASEWQRARKLADEALRLLAPESQRMP